MRRTDRNRAESHPNTSKKSKEEEYSNLKKKSLFYVTFLRSKSDSNFDFDIGCSYEEIVRQTTKHNRKIMKRITFFIFYYSDINFILLGKTPVLL